MNIRLPKLRPEEIEVQSLQIIDREVPDPKPFPKVQWPVVRRMIHASADFELLSLVKFHPLAVEAGIQALTQGCTIFTDTEMARRGITARRMHALHCQIKNHVSDPEIIAQAKHTGQTRSALAVQKVAQDLEHNIYVVGNAPTALIQLLQILTEQNSGPALIIGFPVGFVAAAESKELLLQQDRVPYITIKGRKGGSALAAACINALAELALQDQPT